jgi:hypothetical protein
LVPATDANLQVRKVNPVRAFQEPWSSNEKSKMKYGKWKMIERGLGERLDS